MRKQKSGRYENEKKVRTVKDGCLAKYLRISDDDEDISEEKRESNSIVNQRRLLDCFIAKDKELSEYPSKEFIDDGVSGVSFNRPGIQRLLDEVRRNKITCIIVKDLSRFGRDYIEVGDYIEQIFPFLGVRFISVSDHFDSSKNSAGLEIGFKNLIHDLYSRDLSRKVKSVKAMMQKRGEYSGGDVPYGYVRNEGEGAPYIPDPVSADVVKKIFELAADGISTTKIANKLNTDGVLIPGEYKNSCTGNNYQLKNEKRRLWTASQVCLIIRNEVYIGTFVGRKLSTVMPRKTKKNDESEYLKIENHHDKLVETELFQKAQSVVRNSRKRTAYKKEEQPSPLKGKIKCGWCGYAMSLRCTTNGKYYYCRMGDSCGSHIQIERESLENMVRHTLQKLAEIYCEQEKRNQDKNLRTLDLLSKLKEKIRLLEIQVDYCKTSRLDLYHQWKDGKLEKSEYLQRKDELTRKETEYREELNTEKEKLETLNRAKQMRDSSSVPALITEKIELTKELADELIERVEVYGADRVEIIWKFKL